jgi:hypothetical protein
MVLMNIPKLRSGILSLTLNIPPKDALRPVLLNNACPSRITAAAGTRLAGATFLSNVFIFLNDRVLRPGLFYSRLSP